MLILTRRTDEAIMIDNEIEVRILSICGQQARVGIVAPKNIPVHREEVYKKITEQVIPKKIKNRESQYGMLVLARRPNEMIMIGDNIEVRILRICGQQVRVGITAPENIKVDREEVHMRIKAEAIKKRNDAMQEAAA